MEVHNYLKANTERQELNCNIYHANNHCSQSDEICFCRSELSTLSFVIMVEQLVLNAAKYNESIHKSFQGMQCSVGRPDVEKENVKLSTQPAAPRDTLRLYFHRQKTSYLRPSISIQHTAQVFNLGRHVNIISVRSSCFSSNVVKRKFLSSTSILTFQ